MYFSLFLGGNFFGVTDSISILLSTSYTLVRWHIIYLLGKVNLFQSDV